MASQKYALIGSPVSRSLSPLIYNTAFAFTNLQGSYEALEVSGSTLEDVISRLRMGYAGFNVTAPVKERTVDFLDEASDEVNAIGAVNTVRITDSRLHGFNTDWIGFSHAIGNAELDGKSVIILGAGGSAKAVVYALLRQHRPRRIQIMNRTRARAEQLIRGFQKLAPCTALENVSQRDVKEEIALVVQTTSASTPEYSPVEVNFFKNIGIAFDLVYEDTLFLRQARSAGCRTVGGLRMLVGQAAEAFRIYTGMPCPEEAVLSVLVKAKAYDGTYIQ
ncbi:MAG: shikimate dehydrogenase [Bacteroidetes bacterium]|nr:shikimate dehydrogenase [Bacteroidota bacterium]